ncbi:LysR family transcriptional regulator [Lactobacillus sp. LL6]|uniref:LysR family transcriptional regulator n=1 Tax=Lactobacillus sp. LL6 TaxID=2596827 RepID=UPI001184BCAD|nr:LysR family transcriptional regulator [Lactobacillus sp. LL6]TSO26385.1 LysR family transcriptional regulator [Lactobacillus sp. LL6]
MIDLELLEELVAFNEYGTLSATAEHLMITQPSVTRGMKRLEQELGVTLFDRTVNRISLNETGKLAAKEAKKLLQAENDFTEKIINFDKMQNYIHIGSTAPGPLIWTQAHQDKFKQKLTFNNQLVKENDVISDLINFKERLIFTGEEIENEAIESMFVGTEQLYVRIDPFNPLATKKSVTFADLAGLSFLVVNDIGPWKKVIEDNIPNAKFLYQEDINALDELTHYSNFPTFRSNVTLASNIHERDDDNRISIPIKDENNVIELFGTYLKNQRSIVQPFLKEIIKNWPNN